jgi:hypothetical protein
VIIFWEPSDGIETIKIEKENLDRNHKASLIIIMN